MQFNFAEVVRNLPPDLVPRIINGRRTPSRYVFNEILPNRNLISREAKSGTMTIHSVMAGLVAMDSPYPRASAISMAGFSESLAKVAISNGLNEQQAWDLHELLRIKWSQGGLSLATEAMVQFMFNFVDKILLQPLDDTAEWMKGQALCTGAINWTFNSKKLEVDYGIPAAAFFTQRTGNDAYHGSTSKFWDDIVKIKRYFKGNLRGILAHPDTLDAARYNTANSMAVINESNSSIQFRKINGTTGQFTVDSNDQITIAQYGDSGKAIDHNNPGVLIEKPFMPKGLLLGVGRNVTNDLLVTDTQDTNPDAIGYHHVGPTMEAMHQGDPTGHYWSRTYSPQERPWEWIGEAVANMLPIIENNNLICVASTEMPA